MVRVPLGSTVHSLGTSALYHYHNNVLCRVLIMKLRYSQFGPSSYCFFPSASRRPPHYSLHPPSAISSSEQTAVCDPGNEVIGQRCWCACHESVCRNRSFFLVARRPLVVQGFLWTSDRPIADNTQHP